jgi:hypothetical protein
VKLVALYLLSHRGSFQDSGHRLTGRLFHTIYRAMLNMMMGGRNLWIWNIRSYSTSRSLQPSSVEIPHLQAS